MSMPDAIKEEIGFLKLVFGIVVALDASLMLGALRTSIRRTNFL
jgi:hypothetical protein